MDSLTAPRSRYISSRTGQDRETLRWKRKPSVFSVLLSSVARKQMLQGNRARAIDSRTAHTSTCLVGRMTKVRRNGLCRLSVQRQLNGHLDANPVHRFCANRSSVGDRDRSHNRKPEAASS